MFYGIIFTCLFMYIHILRKHRVFLWEWIWIWTCSFTVSEYFAKHGSVFCTGGRINPYFEPMLKQQELDASSAGDSWKLPSVAPLFQFVIMKRIEKDPIKAFNFSHNYAIQAISPSQTSERSIQKCNIFQNNVKLSQSRDSEHPFLSTELFFFAHTSKCWHQEINVTSGSETMQPTSGYRTNLIWNGGKRGGRSLSFSKRTQFFSLWAATSQKQSSFKPDTFFSSHD